MKIGSFRDTAKKDFCHTLESSHFHFQNQPKLGNCSPGLSENLILTHSCLTIDEAEIIKLQRNYVALLSQPAPCSVYI